MTVDDAQSGGLTKGTDWSDSEVRVVTDSYMRMLRAELRGERYNKAAENARVRESVNRSRGSVEYKFMNISAVLIELGWIPIAGYKPYSNVQSALRAAVAAALVDDSKIESAMRAAVESLPSTSGRLDLVTAPRLIIDASGWTPRRDGVFRDYLLQAERNAALGRSGELAVLDFERSRLRVAGRSELAERVRHASELDGDGLGYDIRSFHRGGRDRFIEVKTTRFAAEVPFFVSANEERFSAEVDDRFSLYRVHRFGPKPKLFILDGSLASTCALEPSEYRAQARAIV
ncbi:DUF3883 domain-containing protein [Agromyces allii]|uniref:DUF3883 domain-containing protein n=1 Tax=Agromyces allii TaxID=393607 RepID=A0ABP5BCP9_9MICO|nr:DUF3883 domain-containing protein [Agromyces allii]